MNAIDRLERARDLATDRSKEITEAVGGVVRATAAAGTTPDGVPWPLTDKGTKPLQDAAEKLRVLGRVDGQRVIAVVKITEKHYFLHHAGLANGAPRRQIIPDGESDAVHAAIKRVLDEGFADG